MQYNNVNTLPTSKLNSSRPKPAKKKKKARRSCSTKTKSKKGPYKSPYTFSKVFDSGDISENYDYGLSDW